MKYCMLLWPHANVRYQNESLKLAQSELQLMLDVFAPEAEICVGGQMNLPALEIVLPTEMPTELMRAMRRHSLMYALFEECDDGLMRLIASRADAYVGADLPGVLKYKGKTNELFLQLLINAALYSGGFARSDDALNLLDPMCGRGTSLFAAANYGWNTAGTDVDKNDLAEAEKFLKRYFEYHHMKYTFARGSRTLAGSAGRNAPAMRFEFSDCAQGFKRGDTRTMQLVLSDAADARAIFGKEKFHAVVCDLPYGVQHAGVGGSVETLLKKALPAWREALKKGGTVALSFNAQTLKREKVRALLSEAGFEVKTGGTYDEFTHWVEQAVTRDIAVGRRTN